MVESNASPTQKAGSFEDARGKPVTLLDPYSLSLLRRHDIIEAEPLRVIAKQVGPGASKWGRRVYWVGFAVGLYSVGSAMFTRVRSSTGLRFVWTDLIILLFFIILFGGLHLYLRSARRARLQRVCAIMLKHLRCPHCGYDIRSLPTDTEDGATVCPECGCAWQLESKANNN